MYIHKNVYDEFVGKLVERTGKIKIGTSLAEDTEMGPKVSKDELEHLNDVMKKALAQGAKILYQKEIPQDDMFKKGYWFMPTILEVPDNSLDVMHEETFGPILPVLKVNDFDEALAYANDCDYGLSAYLYTNDMKKIMRTVNELEFGEVYMNRPCGEEFNAFHNGYKISGVGGEDGKYGMEGYLQKKSVYVNYSE
jgi:lactaldehyde dehydrogenase/glycolaldehyde dehydrogenase